MIKLKALLFTLYFLLFIFYSFYSYAFLDVGLTLTSFKPYLDFQRRIRWFGYFNRPQSTAVFISLSVLLFTLYSLLFNAVKKKKLSLKNVVILAGITAGVLVFSYPAFSPE